MIYSIGKNKIYLVEKKESIEGFIFSTILILCDTNFLNNNLIENALVDGTENFLIFEKNGNLLEDLIDDLIINKNLLKNDFYCNATTSTYDDFDECVFMFMQIVNDFGATAKNDKNHLVFYDKNHFKPQEILSLIKKYDLSF